MELKEDILDITNPFLSKKRKRYTFLPYSVVGSISMLLYFINVIIMFPFFFVLGILKFMIPLKFWREACKYVIDTLGTAWISVNNFNLRITKNIHWEVTGLEGLRMDEWYLVISNHQSWSDILVLQKVFNREIPFLKFFLKKELIWVPLMGIAWWALDFPFMKRYSKEYLKKHPDKKGKDIEITKKACAKFRHIPVSIMNFVEGTRFTEGKHDRQKSPFTNLLRPKAGGISFVLSSIGSQMHRILDVTISYPKGLETFWGFIAGRVPAVKVHIQEHPIEQWMFGDYESDEDYRNNFQEWLNQLWIEKDIRLKAMSM